MNPVIRRIRESIENLKEHHRAELAARVAAAQYKIRADGDRVLAGDRVFDKISGQTGEVVATTSENVIIQDSKR